MSHKSHRCPHCKKPVEWKNNEYRPFCSERCKIMDLGSWASEKYRIPAGGPVNEGDEIEEEKKTGAPK